MSFFLVDFLRLDDLFSYPTKSIFLVRALKYKNVFLFIFGFVWLGFGLLLFWGVFHNLPWLE